MLDIFITSIVVLGTMVFAYIQNHQIVPNKYMQFFIDLLYFNKVVKKKCSGFHSTYCSRIALFDVRGILLLEDGADFPTHYKF